MANDDDIPMSVEERKRRLRQAVEAIFADEKLKLDGKWIDPVFKPTSLNLVPIPTHLVVTSRLVASPPRLWKPTNSSRPKK